MDNIISALVEKGELFDSHAHFSELSGDLTLALQQAQKVGVSNIIDIAVSLKNAEDLLLTARKYPGEVIPTAGLHPELLIPGSDLFDPKLNILNIEKALKRLESFISTNNTRMIGECGLDFYWLNKNGLSKSQQANIKELQEYLFEGQVKLAVKYHLPLSIHSRAAESEAMNILEPYLEEIELAILHSFTGSYEDAATAMEMGLYLGVNGIITYKSAADLRNNLKTLLKTKSIKTPKDLYTQHFLLETDAPLLLPRNAPKSEKENSPALIKNIWEFLYNLVNEI